jgi:aminopeptidase YwaD
MNKLFFVVVLILVSHFSFAQKNKNKSKQKAELISIIDNLKSHVAFLSDDKLEGRRTGTNGEKLAMEYISSQFQKAGLTEKGTDNFYQPFEVNEGKQIDPSTRLSINDITLKLNGDYFPFPYSPDINLEALPSIALKESDMPWFIDLKETLEENKNNPHFDLEGFIKTKAEEVKKKSASALFLYNSSAIDDKLVFNGKDRSPQLAIPVVYIDKNVSGKLFRDADAPLDINLKIKITDKIRKGANVVGFINNNAPNTVILGAHFDHLGYGEDNNSMLRTGEKLIHNGADDNASGTAALIELARMIKTNSSDKKEKTLLNNNYLFIAFSGEELGLYGSKYFTDNPTIDLKTANYMINLDMVGRLSDSSNTLTIGGYGTSPTWSSIYTRALNAGGRTTLTGFNFKFDSSGTGPSDHTSFYKKDIPVLFFFTGLHTDYHKPSDDANRINYNGQLKIVNHIYYLVYTLNQENQKLAFTKTREPQNTGSMRSMSVSMGIMPDYTFSGNGVRCDGVTDGRPAQKAGLKAGDIILQIGDFSITSMDAYMQTLGKFKKGDKTKVKYKRGEETIEAEVQF